MFPLMCVLKSIICSSSLSSAALRTFAPLPLAWPICQSISGMLKSPIKILFLSTLLIRSDNASMLADPPLGGL